MMVLFDHYPAVRQNQDIKTDTYLFILMSGFTTALQLRSSPIFEKKANGNDGGFDVILQARKPFDWRKFLITRVVGIVPLMWFAYIYHAPYWWLQVGCG